MGGGFLGSVQSKVCLFMHMLYNLCVQCTQYQQTTSEYHKSQCSKNKNKNVELMTVVMQSMNDFWILFFPKLQYSYVEQKLT